MTDPRMTPTNDAPVTVEQCDREAGLALRLYTTSIKPGDYRYDRICNAFRSGEWDSKESVQAFARHRLAALASAPAGDGVEDRRYALEWCNEHTDGKWKRSNGGFDVPGNSHGRRYLTDREEALREMAKVNARWIEGTDHRVVMIEETPVGFATDKGRHVVTEPAALARPRAAVGEREALAEICVAMEYWAGCDEGVTPDVATSAIMSAGGAWPATAYDKARAILALQSPPAKVEG